MKKEVCERIERIIRSCEHDGQLLSCENWIPQLKLDEVWESYFYSLIATKQSQLITSNH